MVTLLLYTNSTVLHFWEAIFVTPTIVLAGTIHTLAWKIRVDKCHLSFWYGILPGSFRFQTWCGDFQFRRCISTRALRIESEIFQSQFGNPRISPFEFLLGTASWSKKRDAGMLAGNAKRIFCDNVTCFETNESCWNRSHLPEFFIKTPHFLLAWLLCFFTQTPRFYIFLGGDLCNTYDCPGRNNSYFGLENQSWKMSFTFWVWHPPGFFSFSDMV